jgi:hypothetical protein
VETSGAGEGRADLARKRTRAATAQNPARVSVRGGWRMKAPRVALILGILAASVLLVAAVVGRFYL